MKRSGLFISLVCLIAFSLLPDNSLFAQSPEGVNYQAIARDNNGNALINQMISVRFGIIQGSSNGNLVYEEQYDMITTNDFGLFNLIIGEGAQTNNGSVANFSQINWGAGPLFLRVEVDPGTGFENLGTTELVSVPYALYAKNSGNPLTAGSGISIQNNTINNDGDLSDSNELIESFSLNGSDLEVEDAGGVRSVDLSLFNDSSQIVDSAFAIRSAIPQLAQGIYNDTSATNELIISAQLNGQSLEIVDGGGTFTIDFSTFNDSIQIVDSANVIRQDIAAVRAIAILDSSATNELISSAVLNGQNIEITDAGGTISINLSQFNDSSQVVDTAAAIRNAISLLQTFLLQELTDSAAALRTDLATYSALDDTAMAIRSEFTAFGNVFSDGLNNTNRLTYWNNSDSITYYDNFYIDPVSNLIGIGTTSPLYDLHINGRLQTSWLNINGAYALPVSDGVGNQVMMTDGAGSLSWTTIDTAVCPTAMTNVEGRICIETDERAAADWFTAASTCVSEGFKLPSWGEWYGAMDNANVNDETNNWEWVDGGTSNTARKVGRGDLKSTANDDPNNSLPYRCILILK